MLLVFTSKSVRIPPPSTPSKAVSANENLVTPLPMMVSQSPEDAVAISSGVDVASLTNR